MSGYRSASSAVSSGGSATVPLPAGLAAGDMVLVAVELAGFGGGLTAVLTPPPGFRLLQTTTGSTANSRLYWKTATASEPSGGWVWTSSSSDLFIVDALAYSGYVAVDKSAVSGGLPCPVVTTSYDGEKIVYFRTAYQGGGPTTTLQPAGTNPRPGVGGLTEIISVADLDQTTAGATPSGETWTGSPGGATFTVTLTSNVAPNAPALTGPPDSSTVDRTSAARFSWAFSDPDPADSQSKFDLRYSSDSGATWTTVSGTTPNNYVDIASGTFTDGVSYEWQVRTYDAHGVIGPWSSSRFFTAGTPPVGPTVTYPTAGGIVAYSDRVDWSYPTQTAYQVRRVADVAGAADTSTVYYDSGEVDDPVARTAPVIFDVNSRAEHVQLRVKSGGLWSAWVDRLVNVSYSPPPTPVVAVTVGDSSMSVTITTAAPTGGGPAAEYADVYVSEDAGETWTRLATALAPNGTWTWWTPASGVDYTFRVATVAASGASAYSDWTDWLLIDPGDAASDAPLIDPGGSSADEEIYDGGGA